MKQGVREDGREGTGGEAGGKVWSWALHTGEEWGLPSHCRGIIEDSKATLN